MCYPSRRVDQECEMPASKRNQNKLITFKLRLQLIIFGSHIYTIRSTQVKQYSMLFLWIENFNEEKQFIPSRKKMKDIEET